VGGGCVDHAVIGLPMLNPLIDGIRMEPASLRSAGSDPAMGASPAGRQHTRERCRAPSSGCS